MAAYSGISDCPASFRKQNEMLTIAKSQKYISFLENTFINIAQYTSYTHHIHT